MRLPERLFTNSLARALIEQRRILALDANKNSDVYAALDALMIAPELFTPDAGCYLGLRSLALQLEAARTDDALREVVASMWAFAVTIEDDGVAGSVNAALRSAQDALKQALERGASEDEIKALTRKLREAMAGKVRDVARRAEQNPLGPRQPFPAEVQLILDKAVELRQKTQQATPEQLEELAQQQDALRQQLQAYRKSANSRAKGGGRRGQSVYAGPEMRKLARVPVLRAMSIACLALLLGGLRRAAAPQDQDPDALLDGAEKAMQDAGDSLRQKESGAA